MNRYEMGVVIRADLEEEAFRAEVERVKGLIDRFGGQIEKIDDWGRRKLAYPIKKLTEGMYSFITYAADGPAPREIENRLRLMENVLRFLTVRKDEQEVIAKPAEAVAEPAAEPVAEPAPEPAAEPEAADEPIESAE